MLKPQAKNIEEAMCMTLGFLETHPQAYDYFECEIPHDCGDKGCILGWAAHFLAIKDVRASNPITPLEQCAALLGYNEEEGYEAQFYVEMDNLCSPLDRRAWMTNYESCISTLRRYIDNKFWPEVGDVS